MLGFPAVSFHFRSHPPQPFSTSFGNVRDLQSFKDCGFHASATSLLASLWASGSHRAGNVTGVAALGVTVSGYAAGMATGSVGISTAGQRRGAK